MPLFIVLFAMISVKVSATSVEWQNVDNLNPLRLAGSRLIEVGSLARIYFRENQMSHPSIL